MQLICVLLTVGEWRGDARRLEGHLHPPMVVGILVHGLGHGVPFKVTAVGGPTGFAGSAKIATISPGKPVRSRSWPRW